MMYRMKAEQRHLVVFFFMLQLYHMPQSPPVLKNHLFDYSSIAPLAMVLQLKWVFSDVRYLLIRTRRSLMNCPACRTTNDKDALFCADCGTRLPDAPTSGMVKQRRVYFLAFLFVPIIVIAIAIGYYKFFLPDGVAAVVNNEEIKLSELDAAVNRMKGMRDADAAGLRYQALNELITEKLVLQEARTSGITVSRDEIVSAAAAAQAASGLDERAFNKEMQALYGSMAGFEKSLERRLIINRLIKEKIVPSGADPQTAGRAVNQWLRDLSSKAGVRIALAEQMPGAGSGCGCRGKQNNQIGQEQGRPKMNCGQGCQARGQAATNRTSPAIDSALQYWHARHGADAVTTRVQDFGCHVQIDIVKNDKIISSLRYQNGSITEL
jgi:hypothetical protein